MLWCSGLKCCASQGRLQVPIIATPLLSQFSALLPIQFPADASWQAVDNGPIIELLLIKLGDPEEVISYWFQAGSALVFCGYRENDAEMEDLAISIYHSDSLSHSLSFSSRSVSSSLKIFHSVFQVMKIDKYWKYILSWKNSF